MEPVTFLKTCGLVLLLAAFLELYDLVVPRPFPCSGCQWYEPGCLRWCGRLDRYSKIRAKQRRFRQRVRVVRARLSVWK